MIRTCPKCGDCYADALLAFCLADGTPLVNVEPLSESWREGSRFIEEKEKALKKQKRRLKWRRVFVSAMTMLIAIMVVLVVAVNSFIYLKPGQEEVSPDKPSTPARAPEGLIASVAPGTPGGPTQTPDKTTLTAKPTPAATPTRSNVNTNPKVNNNANVKPDTNTNVHININANSHTNVNTDTFPTVCSDADKGRERNIIIERYGAAWRRSIESDRREIIARAGPAGAGARLGSTGYEIRFLKGCNQASVTLRYEWHADTPVGALNVPKERRFVCGKIQGVWICR